MKQFKTAIKIHWLHLYMYYKYTTQQFGKIGLHLYDILIF